jgi:uncharacterized protein (DUF305 family)
MSSLSRRIAAVLAGAATVTALAACSTTTERPAEPAGHSGHDSPASAAAHNSDDVMFAQMMIPHHRQAVELAALVPEQSSNAELIDLAAAITAQQQPEIDTMQALLLQWGVTPDAPSADHAGMAMQGMVDDATIVQLQGLTDVAFDELWLKSMIAHHQGAVEMANAEVADGDNPDMTTLARGIVSAQLAEIDRMSLMLSGMEAPGG